MAFLRVPGHPYVSYTTVTDPHGLMWIICRCSACGPHDEWRKQCSRPHMVSSYVYMYALEHGHGVKPR